MIINCILASAFIAFLVLLILFYRRALLSKLTAIPGESIMSDEEDITVYETGGGRIRCYNNCRVRLTNSRIIIAQKLPFSSDAFFLRFTVNYKADEAKADLVSILNKGYYAIDVPGRLISLSEKGSTVAVNFPLSPSTARRVEFEIRRSGEFLRAFPPSRQ